MLAHPPPPLATRTSCSTRPVHVKPGKLRLIHCPRDSSVDHAHASSKGGIDQLTRSVAIAWATDNIRVNAVAPGWIDTPLKDEPAYGPVLIARTPLGRFGEPDEVAQAVAFLCSAAASFVTGAILPIYGGYLSV